MRKLNLHYETWIMDIGFKVRELIDQKKVQKKDLYTYLGISRQTLNDYLTQKTSPPVSTIEKIAKFFDMPVIYFFDESNYAITQNGKVNAASVYGAATAKHYEYKSELEKLQIENQHLKERLKDKDELIKMLRKK